MIPLSITTNLDIDPWTDLPRDQVKGGQLQRIGLLPAGMASGKASVAMLATTEDDQVVVIETSWALFHTAATALAASPIAEMEHL